VTKKIPDMGINRKGEMRGARKKKKDYRGDRCGPEKEGENSIAKDLRGGPKGLRARY